jgi:hypothetical protein
MINFPTYKILTGIAERTIRISAVATVSDRLVLQTSLKNDGRLPKAENRSFNETSAIYKLNIYNYSINVTMQCICCSVTL